MGIPAVQAKVAQPTKIEATQRASATSAQPRLKTAGKIAAAASLALIAAYAIFKAPTAATPTNQEIPRFPTAAGGLVTNLATGAAALWLIGTVAVSATRSANGCFQAYRAHYAAGNLFTAIAVDAIFAVQSGVSAVTTAASDAAFFGLRLCF